MDQQNAKKMNKFDGKSSIEERLQQIPLSKYKIEISIVDKDDSVDFSQSDSTPPMPANIGGWAILKKSEDKYFFYNSDLQEGSNITFDPSEENYFTIEANEKENRTKFYLNDELIAVKRYYTRLKAHYRLGVGYRQRYWKGKIKRVSIYGDTRTSSWDNLLVL